MEEERQPKEPTQHGIRLAVHIIESHFGRLVSQVLECILVKGSVTSNQIVNHTGLSRNEVKKCLLVLIQHNCIQPFNLEQRGGFNEGNSVSVQYTAIFCNILHRMRFPKFLHLVSEKLGKECAAVLHGLFEHGRLTLEQINKRAESTQSEAPLAVHDSFKCLVSARFVERCPDSDPFINLPTDEETTANNRNSKFSKLKPKTIEQRAIDAAIPMEAKRFLISYNNTPDDTADSEADAPSFLSSGDKRKRVAFSEADDEPGAAHCMIGVLWRPNFEEFVRCLRHKACIVHERARFGEEVATVLSAMLEGSRNPEGRVISRHSAPLSLNAIYEEVMKTEDGRTMTLDHVRSSLVQLGCGEVVNDRYSVDMNEIIRLCQNEEVESCVLKRYGLTAYMIIRVLSKESKPFETEKLSQVVLRDKRTTEKILFMLWKDNLVSMEIISTPGLKSMQYLLWKINKGVWKQYLDRMLHAAMNLMNRASFELNREAELMELPKSKITGVLATKKARLNSIRGCLEVSLMRLDDAIHLFQHFYAEDELN